MHDLGLIYEVRIRGHLGGTLQTGFPELILVMPTHPTKPEAVGHLLSPLDDEHSRADPGNPKGRR